MQEATRFERVRLPGLSLHVAQAGPEDGVPVILLHGFPESHLGWRRQAGPLAAAGFRAIMPDQRGYNLSDRPDGIRAYHIDRLGQDVIALANALGLGRFRLVGHDWGAVVAWWTAAFHPDRVERLAVLNGPHPAAFGPYALRHPGQWLKSWYVALFQLPRLPEAHLTADGGATLRRLLKETSRRGAFPEADLDRYARAWLQPGAMTAMLNWYRALRLPRRRPPLVTVPTLILWGRRDTALEPGLAQASLAHCRDGRIRWFPEATHWLQHEEAPAVNAALIDFLK